MADLTPYIAGAATTLLAQAVLQLYVVPRVELRKRREDRWEQAVVDLGVLLGKEVLDAHYAALSATLDLYVRRPEDSRSDEAVAAKAAASMWSYRQLVNTRVRMAADSIVSLDPDAPSLQTFAAAVNSYRSAVGALALYAPRAGRDLPQRQTPDSTYDERYGLTQGEAAQAETLHGELFTQVRHLARSRPPSPSVRRKIGRALRRVRPAAAAVRRAIPGRSRRRR